MTEQWKAITTQKSHLYTKAQRALKIYLTCRDEFLMVTLAWTPSLHESTVASLVRLHLTLQYDSSDDSSQCFVSIIQKSTNKKKGDFSLIHTLKAIYLCNSINGLPSNIF